MNDTDASRSEPFVPPPLPAAQTGREPDNVLEGLLKDPAAVANAIAGGRSVLARGATFLVGALICHAIFGLAMGFFGGWTVAGMTLTKAALVALCSLVLCLPSLYVFSCVGGAPLSMSQVALLATSCQAMVGLLLVGLAPVAWLFAVSTSSLGFVVCLNAVLWGIAVGFVVRYIAGLEEIALFRNSMGIRCWLVVLALVTLQMTTCMRPLLTRPEAGWWTPEKKFFLSHFSSCFETDSKKARK